MDSYKVTMLVAEKAGLYCDSCRYFPVKTKEYKTPRWSQHSEVEKFRFCEFCTHTMTSSEVMYPGSQENIETLRAIAWGHNRLMAEIREN